MTITFAATLFFSVCAASSAFGARVAPTQAPAPTETAPATKITLDLKREPFLELWFEVRASSVGDDEPHELLREAVVAARALDEALGNPLAYGPLEGVLASCTSAADALTKLDRVRERVAKGPAEEVELRAPAKAVLIALEKIESAWRQSEWPERERALTAATSALRAQLDDKEEALWTLHARRLGFEGLELRVPCVLVTSMPAPGAVTHRGEDGRGVCFVALGDAKGATALEIVVHEATHALDLARDDDLFDRLRDALRAAGASPRDRVLRDAPHTLMFLASAASVRDVVAADHEDYGDTHGYYAKVGNVIELQRPLWRAHLTGRSTREEFVEQLARELIGAKPKR